MKDIIFIILLVLGSIFTVLVISWLFFVKINFHWEKKYWEKRLKEYEKGINKEIFLLNKEIGSCYISKNKYTVKIGDFSQKVPLMLITTKGLFLFEIKKTKGHISGNYNNDYLELTKENEKVVQIDNILKRSNNVALNINKFLGEEIPTLCFVIYTNNTHETNILDTPANIVVSDMESFHNDFALAYNSLENKIKFRKANNIFKAIKKGIPLKKEKK